MYRDSSRPLVALLPSPLLGPAVWRPVERSLRDLGEDAVAVDPWHGRALRAPADVLTGLLTVLPPDRELILVPHSNAGLYVPALTRHRQVAAAIFVDAVLPPRQGAAAVAPTGLVDMLRRIVDADGVLPVWTAWWDESEVDRLFPSQDARSAVEREQQRMPLSYFSASVQVPSGWDDRPVAYLGFDDTYSQDQAEAARRQWPVATMPGGHLHMLAEPDAVAAELIGMIERLRR